MLCNTILNIVSIEFDLDFSLTKLPIEHSFYQKQPNDLVCSLSIIKQKMFRMTAQLCPWELNKNNKAVKDFTLQKDVYLFNLYLAENFIID